MGLAVQRLAEGGCEREISLTFGLLQREESCGFFFFNSFFFFKYSFGAVQEEGCLPCAAAGGERKRSRSIPLQSHHATRPPHWPNPRRRLDLRLQGDDGALERCCRLPWRGRLLRHDHRHHLLAGAGAVTGGVGAAGPHRWDAVGAPPGSPAPAGAAGRADGGGDRGGRRAGGRAASATGPLLARWWAVLLRLGGGCRAPALPRAPASPRHRVLRRPLDPAAPRRDAKGNGDPRALL